MQMDAFICRVLIMILVIWFHLDSNSVKPSVYSATYQINKWILDIWTFIMSVSPRRSTRVSPHLVKYGGADQRALQMSEFISPEMSPNNPLSFYLSYRVSSYSVWKVQSRCSTRVFQPASSPPLRSRAPSWQETKLKGLCVKHFCSTPTHSPSLLALYRSPLKWTGVANQREGMGGCRREGGMDGLTRKTHALRGNEGEAVGAGCLWLALSWSPGSRWWMVAYLTGEASSWPVGQSTRCEESLWSSAGRRDEELMRQECWETGERSFSVTEI